MFEVYDFEVTLGMERCLEELQYIFSDPLREDFVETFYQELAAVPNARVNLPGILPTQGDLNLLHQQLAEAAILGSWDALEKLQQCSEFSSTAREVLGQVLDRPFEEYDITGDRDADGYALEALGRWLHHVTELKDLDLESFDLPQFATLLRAGFATLFEMMPRT